MTIWIKAFRLQTLPLAVSCTLVGSFLAVAHGRFSWSVFALASLTTLILQILANLANDYGDALHGADDEKRLGPLRVTQRGLVTRGQMRGMIGVFVLLALLSGSLLVFVGLREIGPAGILFFLLLGLSAIAAAIMYTVGKKPYGYAGMGDVFVFIYFGIVGVVGTFYLHVHSFDAWILLPAAAIGLLSCGVLNLNNMRDIDSDTRAGKRTIAVRIGRKAAVTYHISLIVASFVFTLAYILRYFTSVSQLLFIVTLPLFLRNIKAVAQNNQPVALNSELKNLALSTFAFSVIFGIGLLFS